MIKILERLIDKVTEKATRNKWKTVEDFLPEDGEEVLVYRICSCRFGNTPHITIGVYYKNTGWYDLEYDMNIHDVIVWRHFPKIPRRYIV